MRIHLTSIFLILAVALCAFGQAQSEDGKFEALANDYIENLLVLSPEWATNLGDHRFDDRLNNYRPAGIQKKLDLHRRTLDLLASVDIGSLSDINRIDCQILEHNVRRMIFELETLKEHEWNPRIYNPGGAIYALIARDFAPLKERLRSVIGRLQAIPGRVITAKSNLNNPPRIYTETAIRQNQGTIQLIRHELKTSLEQVPELEAEFLRAQEGALQSLEDYGVWLEEELLPNSKGDFRLGEENYRKKLYYTLASSLSKEEILKRAEAELKATQEAIYETALPLYRAYFPDVTDPAKLADRKHVVRSVLDKLAQTRPTNDTVVKLARECLEECTDFTRAHDLVTVPQEPIELIVMPEFQRGVSVAYCDAPGPLERNAKTFYAIAPTPEDWPDGRVISFFREYNNYMLRNLTVHEAMPGHYLQLAHSNRFRAPTMIRAIFHSGTFIEGWAVFTEQLMAEKGYGGPEVKMQQLKMRLRVIINAIIDQKIHAGDMTEEEAMALMINEGFQEEGEAAGKWRRACLTSTQLSTYFVGVAEVNDIRRAYEAKHGSGHLREMNDLMLSFGSPPAKFVRELMGL